MSSSKEKIFAFFNKKNIFYLQLENVFMYRCFLSKDGKEIFSITVPCREMKETYIFTLFLN